MSIGLDTLPQPALTPGPTLAPDFDIEFGLLEDRIRARLQPRGLRGRLGGVVRGRPSETAFLLGPGNGGIRQP